MRTVTLYGRADCHLCDDARSVLERIRAEVPFVLVECDIEADEDLLREYFERIPVIALDGRELCEYFVDEDALRAALAESACAGDELESER